VHAFSYMGLALGHVSRESSQGTQNIEINRPLDEELNIITVSPGVTRENRKPLPIHLHHPVYQARKGVWIQWVAFQSVFIPVGKAVVIKIIVHMRDPIQRRSISITPNHHGFDPCKMRVDIGVDTVSTFGGTSKIRTCGNHVNHAPNLIPDISSNQGPAAQRLCEGVVS